MKNKLILASRSIARQKILCSAGYDFDSYPADIDEEKILKKMVMSNNIKDIPLTLSKEKAKVISNKFPDNYIIGSDQVLVMDGKIYSKAKNKDEAKKRLKFFQGKKHKLISAVSVYKKEELLFSYVDEAELIMRSLDDQEIEKYCIKAGDILTNCVGCYALEGIGLRLFERIQGDYFTILGMPLLPLSNFLDSEGFQL